jgi:predicted dienelactone hydrolase
MAASQRRWPRRVLTALLVLVVLLGGYVGYVAVRAAQPVTLPTETGPYPVGRTIVDWTDHSRTDPLAPRPDQPRELSVWLWYPATPTNAQAAPYLPGAWAGLHLHGIAGIAETGVDDVHSHARADVPFAAGQFPLVVLEPGLGFAAPQYTTIAEHLASHGYVVAGVTPTYSANLTVLDGRVVHQTAAGNPAVFDSDDLHAGQAQTTGDRLVAVWAADDLFAAARTASTEAGHVDTRTLYVGHSFGGAAALEACRQDPHCVGAADLDGTQYGTVVHTGLNRPMLLVGSENSCITGNCQPASADDRSSLATARALLRASTGRVSRFQIKGSRHVNFSDYGVYYLAAPVRAQLALGGIDGVQALTVTNGYLTAFADQVSR